MTDTAAPEAGQTYRIGAVARLTGIPPDTLRVWERRYSVVTPFRSDAGTRLYRADDVGRLALIKRLVDNGDAISHVAKLSLELLRERVRGLTPAPRSARIEVRPCRVAVLGSTLPAMVERDKEDAGRGGEALDFVGLFSDEARFRDSVARLEPDIVVLECPTIHQDQLRWITELTAHSGAPRALVVYNFASHAVIRRLEAQQVVAQRAPLSVADLKRWCLGLHATGADLPAAADMLADLDFGSPIPPRRFDGEALSRIAAASPTVRCECPHHLVQLVTSLIAFETYSQECESRNSDDAALHAFLHAATARARSTLESALARVVEAEDIQLS